MPLFGKDGPVITEEQMWSNYEYFIKAVLPVAEEEGLRLALHPDDPPVPMLGGVAHGLVQQHARGAVAPEDG